MWKMTDEIKKQKLVPEEVEVLTICYEKPGTIEVLAEDIGKEIVEVEAVLKSLAEKKLVKEAEGTWSTTTDGDFYIEETKNPAKDSFDE